MTLYCGIDLHANNSVISVIDDRDNVLWKVSSDPTYHAWRSTKKPRSIDRGFLYPP